MKVSFGQYTLDLATGELWHRDLVVRLAPQPSKLLVLLVERRGALVTREEIRQQLWDQDTFVDFDQSLNACIRQIRSCFRDNADQPAYIETLPRRGYRFLPEVTPLTPPDAEAPAAIALTPAASESAPTAPASVAIPVHETSAPTWQTSAGRRSSRLVIAAVAALGVLVAVASYLYYRSLHRAHVLAVEEPPARTVRPAVAVYGFRNMSGEGQDDWLSIALTEMLDSQLSGQDRLRVVPSTEVAQTRQDLKLGEAGPNNWTVLRKATGADLLVTGSYRIIRSGSAPALSLDVQIENMAERRIEARFGQNGDLAHLHKLIEATGVQLGTLLLPGEHISDDPNSLAGISSNETALRYYTEGIRELRHYDSQGARNLFEKAIAADPQFAMAHARLSDAFDDLGNIEAAKVEARKAFELSKNLPRSQRILAEATYYDIESDNQRAIALYRALFTFYPDEAEWGLKLAHVQSDVNDYQGTLATVAALRAIPLTPTDEIDTDYREAAAYDSMTIQNPAPEYFAHIRKAIDHGIEVAKRSGSQLLLGQALRAKCQIDSERQDSLDDATAACEQEKEIFRAVGNIEVVASATNNLALMAQKQGRIDEAVAGVGEARRLFKEIGNLADTTFLLESLTILHNERGDLAEVIQNGEQLTQAHETGFDARFHFFGAFYEVWAHLEQGNLERADAALRQAAMFAEQGATEPEKLDDRIFEKDLGIRVAMARGNYEQARNLLHDHRALIPKDDSVDLAINNLRTAQLENAQNQTNSSSITALPADMKTFAASDMDQDYVLQAAIALAYQKLSQNKFAEAAAALASGKQLQDGVMVTADSHMGYLLAQARVQYASQQRDQALATLDREIELARSHGYLYRQLQGEIQLNQWKQNSAELKRLAQQASHLGFAALASEAASHHA